MHGTSHRINHCSSSSRNRSSYYYKRGYSYTERTKTVESSKESTYKTTKKVASRFYGFSVVTARAIEPQLPLRRGLYNLRCPSAAARAYEVQLPHDRESVQQCSFNTAKSKLLQVAPSTLHRLHARRNQPVITYKL